MFPCTRATHLWKSSSFIYLLYCMWATLYRRILVWNSVILDKLPFSMTIRTSWTFKMAWTWHQDNHRKWRSYVQTIERRTYRTEHDFHSRRPCICVVHTFMCYTLICVIISQLNVTKTDTLLIARYIVLCSDFYCIATNAILKPCFFLTEHIHQHMVHLQTQFYKVYSDNIFLRYFYCKQCKLW